MAKDKSKTGKAGAAAADADALDEAQVEGEGGENAEDGGKKKPPLRLILIAAAGALVVLGAAGAGVMFLMPHRPAASAHKLPPKPKADRKDGKTDPNTPQVQDGPDGVVFYTLPDIVVNMQTPDGKPTFLKLKLTFELPDHDTADTIDAEMPRLQDIFQTYLREMRPEELLK